MDESSRGGLILQHSEDGPPARFASWCEDREVAFATHPVWSRALPEDPAAFAWICSLGSEQTPGKDGRPQWVDAEIGFLGRALATGVPVLGLCFGGQALACAAGGSVGPADPAEVGWHPIASAVPELVPEGPWLHFHYDQLHPPAGAELLARSAAGAAAFRLGRSVGLQFHPEATPEIANGWAEMEAETLARIGIAPDLIAEQGMREGGAAALAAERLFDAWWAGLGG